MAWFAGLCDGEGCFTVDFGYNTKTSRKPRVSLFFCIGMNRGEWILKVTQILNDMEIPFHVKRKKRTHVSEIRVGSNKSVKKICEAIYPYTMVKTELIKKFMEYPGLPRSNQFKPVSVVEVRNLAELVDFVRKFNRKKNIPYKWDGKMLLQAYGITNAKP